MAGPLEWFNQWQRNRSSKEAIFERDVESPDGTGQKCCLSAPIDDMDPDRFWDALENWMFNKGCIKEMCEAEYVVSKCEDGGVLAVTTYSTTSTLFELFAGKLSGKVHMKYYLDREKDELRSYNYNTDETLSKKSLSQENVLKVWRDPFRFEFYINELEARLCGPFAKAWAEPILRGTGLNVELFCNMDSPSEPGEKSIVSGPIEDPEWSFEKFWETYKAGAIRDFQAQEVKDDILVMEMNNILFTLYTSICLVEDGTMIVTRNHDNDETLCECKAEFWQKVIHNPTRLEVWMKNMPYRESGVKAQFIADNIMNAILRFARGEAVVKLPDELQKVVDDVSKYVQSEIEKAQKASEGQAAIEGSASAEGAASTPQGGGGTEEKSQS
mmetsp:Transcript_17853/g.41983  ORF Transcript_17853/g.41983 Transcript_17853/m.41983 type:complete len:385 (-) Transcript_17853:164-1318(-)